MRRLSVLLLSLVVVMSALAGKKEGKEVGRDRPALPSSAALVLQPSATILFSEGFNDTSLTGFPPAGWTMRNMDGNIPVATPDDSSWYQSLTVGGANTQGPQEGLAFAADYYGTANGDNVLDDWIISPNWGSTAPAGSTDSLSFWVVSRLSTSGSYPDSLEIRVSTTNASPASFTTVLGYINVGKTAWTRYAYKLANAATRYVAFRYLVYNGGASGDNSDKVCLDNVRISRDVTSAVALGNNDVPGILRLEQNFPNPFNPTTTITYSMPFAGDVALAVYDMLGREVATLAGGHAEAGIHIVTFDASGLASGVYCYRLRTGAAVASKTMVLSR